MSEVAGSSGGKPMTDREIAEDLLAGQKYLSNYYYAPAILESGDPALRSAFQELHAGATRAANSVFDYLHSKGWYQVRKADQETLSHLRNAVHQSRQVMNSTVNMGGTNVSMNQGQVGWTGTQIMEGQSGMGPSSVSQGARWGGESSWMSGSTGQFQGTQHQGGIPDWARGGYGAQSASTGWQGSTGWTGTQYGEGQSGFGPSSLAQGARWGGQPSWISTGAGQIHGTQQYQNIPQWAQRGFGSQSGFGVQEGAVSRQGWTGTQYGEGQSGFGPSSLGQSAQWGGEPSWMGFGGQYQSGHSANLPNWARGGTGFGQGGPGQQVGFVPGQPSLGFQHGGTQQGLGGMQGSPTHFGTGSWQRDLGVQRQGWQLGSQGNWQSQ